jgi:hypothetical protein
LYADTWLATDLLRVLNDLRFSRHGHLPDPVRYDLDYHAGLLSLCLERTPREHTTKDHHQ